MIVPLRCCCCCCCCACSVEAQIQWTPSRDPSLGPRPSSQVQTLFSSTLDLLVRNIDAVISLYGVPDVIKTALAARVCQQRLMSPAVAQLFADSAPTELVLADCTQLDATATAELLATAGSRRLDRLELCYCGRGFGDETAVGLVQKVELSGLLELKLTGAYRLSEPRAQGAGQWGRGRLCNSSY
jgi:DNA repair protein RAD7